MINAITAGFRSRSESAANTVAWNALMDRAKGGEVVYLPGGDYILSGAVHKIPAGVTVRGAGKKLTRIVCAGDVPSPNTFLQLATGASLCDLTVDINGQNANGVCIFEAKYCLVDGVDVVNCPGYGFWIIDYGGQQDLAPTVEAQGSTGATTYGYIVAAYDSSGTRIRTAAEVTITDGNATLDGTNYNQIDWSEIRDADEYRVWRETGGATQGLVATITDGTLTLDDTGLTGDTTSGPAELHATVQYGHSNIRNCYVEAKEGFECFYVEEVNFESCFAVGVTDLGDESTVSINGFLNRDQCRGIRYSNCHATGTFTLSALKWTNNDDQVLYESDSSIVNCSFSNDYDDAARWCMYILDMADVRVKNTVCRATNGCSGVFFSVTATTDQDCRCDIEVDVSCAGAGVALDHGRGNNVTYRGRFKTTSAQYLVEIGTNSSKSDNIVFDRCDFHFDSDHASARLFKWNDCNDTTYDGCRFLGDGTNYQMGDLGASSNALRVKFIKSVFDGVRINKFHKDGWSVKDCVFKNTADAAIGSGCYINCNGASVTDYNIIGNEYLLEGSTPPTAFLTGDTGSRRRVFANGRYGGATVPYTVTNVVATRTIDADATTLAEVADVLCTLLQDLGQA